MLKITEKIRDDIVNELAKSNLPINVGLAIIQLLNTLEKIEDNPKKDGKEN